MECVLSPDPKWPSAATLLVESDVLNPGPRALVKLLGAHTYATSVTPRSPQSTPAAVRAALARYSTWSFEDHRDLADAVVIEDRGDVPDPDTEDGARVLARELDGMFGHFWLLLGGDNALTWRAMSALARGHLVDWGLITLDAHLDMRDGQSNGSPVRQLLEEGLVGSSVVQVGLADFSNSAAYARDAGDAGVRVIARHEIRRRSIADVVAEAVEIAGAGDRPVYVDIDMDVCDRSVVPGCPAAAPGGLSADELREFVRLLSAHPRVIALDVTEIDVALDAPDERTVRLAALVVLEALAGYLRRPAIQGSGL
jgi:formiminoglutamase